MNYIIGIDIGGTNLVLGAVAEDGSALHGLRKEPTRAEEGPDAVVARLVGLSRQAIEDTRAADPSAEVIGVGIGSPGPLDRVTGRVLITPNLGWTNFPLRDAIREALALPTALDNDANCAVLGEWWQGAARDTRFAVGITIGTGIGGGIIIDGKLYHGFSEVAGELGHTTIDSDGRLCKCGNYGCLEAYAAGPAIARRAVEAVKAGVDSSLPKYVDGNLEALNAQIVYEAAPRHRDRQSGEHLQSGSGGGVRWRHHGRRQPVRSAQAGSAPPGLPAGGGGVPHRPGRADRDGGSVWRGAGVPRPGSGRAHRDESRCLG